MYTKWKKTFSFASFFHHLLCKYYKTHTKYITPWFNGSIPLGMKLCRFKHSSKQGNGNFLKAQKHVYYTSLLEQHTKVEFFSMYSFAIITMFQITHIYEHITHARGYRTVWEQFLNGTFVKRYKNGKQFAKVFHRQSQA